jgi:hypothetical protein
MKRTTLLTVLIAALLGTLVPPAGAAISPGIARSERALARASYSAFRHPPGAADRIPAASMTAAQRGRLRGAAARRIAHGRGWEVFLAIERGRRAHDTELVAVGRGMAVEGPPVLATVKQFVRHGALITFTPQAGERTTVVLVPDRARAAQILADGAPAPTPLPVSGNAIVTRTPGAATIRWRMPDGRSEDTAVAAPEHRAGLPVTATLLDGSHVTVDLGAGNVRTIAISGVLGGSMPSGYMLNRDNTIELEGGRIDFAPTDVLTDSCPAPALARTVAATNMTLDPGHAGSVLLARDGLVTTTFGGILHTILSLRQPDGCGLPTLPSGQAETPLTIRLVGQIQRGTGLARLELRSDPMPIALQACLEPGDPGSGCAKPTALPATVTSDVFVKVAIGAATL